MANPQEIASHWLSVFAPAAEAGDLSVVLSSFLPSGWLRDVLIFTWDTRSLEGHDKIASYLANTLAAAKISSIKLDERPHLAPEFQEGSVLAGFTFETRIALGLGRVILVPAGIEWKALSVCMTMQELKGHEESGPQLGMYDGHTVAWQDVYAKSRAEIEKDPEVIIIGAGQTGLMVAARFKQMKIPTLVVDERNRVGDPWRARYPTLNLHTTRTYNTFLYQPYPSNWPLFIPRDKIADWMEQYAITQDLIVWTNSRPLPGATYNAETKGWDIIIQRGGVEVRLRPAHIVIALGIMGRPRVPSLRSPEVFKGSVFHSSRFTGGQPYAGQRVIVVGAGNTAGDICLDLVHQGAKSVTMIQRSATCAVTLESVAKELQLSTPPDVPVEVSDLKQFTVSVGLIRKFRKDYEEKNAHVHKHLHDQLTKGGYKVNRGPDGSGYVLLLFQKAAGYLIDVGVAALIESGEVRVKQGVEPMSFTEDTVVFSDGSVLEGDTVIFATGYDTPREGLKEIFGASVIDQTSEIWGLDEEQEIRGAFRPTGHPALWYAAGDFAGVRVQSKQLALLIKATQLRLRD